MDTERADLSPNGEKAKKIGSVRPLSNTQYMPAVACNIPDQIPLLQAHCQLPWDACYNIALGARGRKFESCRPDQSKTRYLKIIVAKPVAKLQVTQVRKGFPP
jgi:hypothetical protein